MNNSVLNADARDSRASLFFRGVMPASRVSTIAMGGYRRGDLVRGSLRARLFKGSRPPMVIPWRVITIL